MGGEMGGSKPKRKDLFKVTWDNIAPPYNDYEYFKDCHLYPFQYDSDSFSLSNAWWLIESATLSYCDESFASERFKRAGFSCVKYFTDKSTQCYVVSNKIFAILAFRGTESRKREGRDDIRDIVEDIKADANIRLVDSGKRGRVHKGFNDALDEVWNELYMYLKDLQSEERKIWITGHSLGAALATLAAFRFKNVKGLYTFGSPRVGDTEFCDDFHITTFRFENNNDIVCKVPPPMPDLYSHVGKLKYIDNDGKIHDDISPWERWTDEVEGRFENAMSSLGRGFEGLVPDAIKDHVPILYAIHIWNNLVEQFNE